MRWVDNFVATAALLGEARRCVHIGDREADIYELFCAANDVGAHFVIRSAYPRLVEDGTTKTDAEIEEVRHRGLHRITVRDKDGAPSEAVLELRYHRMLVLAPVVKQGLRPTGIDRDLCGGARDAQRPAVRQLEVVHRSAVRSGEEAIEKLLWHALRWKIKVFHKILKFGCRVEESRLRTAPRLVNLIATTRYATDGLPTGIDR